MRTDQSDSKFCRKIASAQYSESPSVLPGRHAVAGLTGKSRVFFDTKVVDGAFFCLISVTMSGSARVFFDQTTWSVLL